MKPLTINEIAMATGGKLNHGDGETYVTGVSTDSRTINPGELFVPVTGVSFDAHDFIDGAVAKGAACVLSQRELATDAPVVIVKDTRQAMLDLAAYYKSLFSVKTVAITGSNGKTTAKDMTASVIGQRFKILKNQGSYNNDVGLPLTVFQLDESYAAAVLEMGMNNPGEIGKLSLAAKPDAALITNIGVAHLGRLGTREAIRDAKYEILQGLRSHGKVYLNGDDCFLREAGGKNHETVFFGLGPENDYYAHNIKTNGIYGTSFILRGKGGVAIPVELPVPGEHMVINALAAAAVGFGFGLTPQEVSRGLRSFQPSKYRLDIKSGRNGVTILEDTYNANPDSVRAALDVLALAKGRKVCVLGDMLELGTDSEAMHRDVGAYAAKLGIDVIVTVGEGGGYIRQGAITDIDYAPDKANTYWLKDKAAVMDELPRLLSPGDTVLLKASRAMAFEDITQTLL